MEKLNRYILAITLSLSVHFIFLYIFAINKTKKTAKTETAKVIPAQKSYIRFTHLKQKKNRIKKTSRNNIKESPKGTTAKKTTKKKTRQTNRKKTKHKTEGAIVNANALEGLSIKYPKSSIRRHEEGQVVVSIKKENNKLKYIIIKKSLHDRLNQAAINSLINYEQNNKLAWVLETKPYKILFNFQLK